MSLMASTMQMPAAPSRPSEHRHFQVYASCLDLADRGQPACL